MRTLIWFRADLRIHDQPALTAAVKAGAQGVLALYILTPKTWQYHKAAPVKIAFILRNLQKLQTALHALNIPLQVHTVPEYQDCAELLVKVCQQHEIKKVYATQQYEVDERRRDEAVAELLKTKQIEFHLSDSGVLITPGMILTQQQQPIKVFTPFKKKWLAFWQDHAELQVLPAPKRVPHAFTHSNEVPKSLAHFACSVAPELWPAGEEAALARLKEFLKHRVQEYHQTRDFPALDSTSRLSPYLAQGIISIRRVLMQLCAHEACDNLVKLSHKPGAGTWLNELIWREFYQHIMFLFPKICCYQAWKAQYQHWPWRHDKTLFQAWCQGKTGYPLIDAAMRQLNQTGWMHNRLRMNVAMFLSKLLMVDWHWGENYFAEHLVDGDLAANNGGWQWSAGTGTDAAPYFRIFNPLLQSERFDPQGEFIRQFCPELEAFDAKAIHDPHGRNPALAKKVAYPKPIVDYKHARAQALDLLRHLK